jgi:hypothetical protein
MYVSPKTILRTIYMCVNAKRIQIQIRFCLKKIFQDRRDVEVLVREGDLRNGKGEGRLED